jgi:hypothetical protein
MRDMPDEYVRILEWMIERGLENPFQFTELQAWAKKEGLLLNMKDTQALYTQLLGNMVNNVQPTPATFVISLEGYFRYLEYVELREARRTAKEAREAAERAQRLAAWSIFVAILAIGSGIVFDVFSLIWAR